MSLISRTVPGTAITTSHISKYIYLQSVLQLKSIHCIVFTLQCYSAINYLISEYI
jgi:hypothetical protein